MSAPETSSGHVRAFCRCGRRVIARRDQFGKGILIDALPRVGGDLVLLADGLHYRRLDALPDDGKARYAAHQCAPASTS